MKKLLIGIFVPVLILAGLAGGCYYAVYDGSSPSKPEGEIDLSSFSNQKLVHAFDSTKDTGKLSLNLTQKELDLLLNQSFASSAAKDYVRGVNISIDKSDYHIKVYCNASFLKTMVDLTCSFSSDEDNYYLTIKDAKIGKVTFLDDLAFTVLGNVMTDEQLNQQFSIAGLHMKAELKKRRIVYPIEDALLDLRTLLRESTSENEMVAVLSSLFVSKDVLSFRFEDELSVDASLASFHTNSDFVDSDNTIDTSLLDFSKSRLDVISLLDSGKIDTESEHEKTVFDFLNRGYLSLSDSQKEYIDSADLSSIGYSDKIQKSLHNGYRPADPDIENYFAVSGTGLSNPSLLNEEGLLLKESLINQYLHSQGIVGYSYVFSCKEDGKYDVQYVAIDNAYFNFYTKNDIEHMDLVLSLDVSGYDTTLVLENTKSQSLPYGMKVKNENIYFGTSQADESVKSFAYHLIQDYLPENEFLTFDGNDSFVLNFEGYLKDYLSLVNTLLPGKSFSLDSRIEGKSLTDKDSGLRLSGSLR